jgi:outer membrane protein assembly factor BamD
MKRGFLLLVLIFAGVLLLPLRCPAPFTYTPGEGWTYESVGGTKWQRARAKDQYEVAKAAFDQKKYGLAAKAARRTVKRWPLSDYAAQAQFLLGRCYEARHQDEKAFKEYQKVIEKYPKALNYSEILQRQYAIAGRFLAGQWFKLWGYIPFFPSMEKTADMYAKIVRNGPYTDLAPQAQMKIGAAREKQKEYSLAVRAYEKAADVYHDDRKVASDATFKAGLAYQKQAQTAEYDQSAAGSAISTFNDFIVLFPDDKRTTQAQKVIVTLRTEQARGAFQVARFYDKRRKWLAAQVYYSEAVNKDPDSVYAAQAKERLQVLKRRTAGVIEAEQNAMNAETGLPPKPAPTP